MAEAHDFASLTLKVTHDGISLSYDEELLRAIWKTFFRSYKKKFARIMNDFQASIFPLKSSSLFIFLGITLIGTFLGIDVSFGIAPFLNHWLFAFIFGSETVCSFLASITATGLLWVLFVLTIRRSIKFCLRYKGYMSEGVHAGKVSMKTKLWFSLLNLIGKAGPKLYSYQGLLPHLPVPSLDETLSRHLESMKPLLSAEELLELKDLSEKFKKGIGRRLQRYLVLKSWLSNNYISDWWEEFVYLRQRSPIMINSNYYGFDKINVHPTTNQAARAANVTWAVLQFRRLIERQEVSPFAVSQKSQIPFCSSQYPRMMNSVRIPGEETDTIVRHDDSRHVAVYSKGCWYKLPIHNGSRMLKPAELQPIYEEIINSNDVPAPGEEKVAVFTAGERTHWAKARKTYFSSGVNKKSLQTIESAAFVIILDDEEVDYDPKDPSKLTKWAESLLHGKGYDRWFDKSLNFIIYKNGRMGANVEHSYADGATTAHAMSVLLATDIVKQGYDENGNTIGTRECVMKAERLKWDLGDNVQKEMQVSMKVAQDLIDDVEMSLLIWDEYGKGFIKKLKVSPDAFLQAALQLTYFRNQDKFSLTYEASMTRLFVEGRTETVRSCTTESCAFVKAMMNPECSREERLQLLRTAAERHQDLYRLAMSGKGVDRHLFALYVVMKYLEEVSPFFDKIFPPTYLLSTSQTPMTQGEYETRDFDQAKLNNLITPGGGFGPVADDGYGVSYIIIKEDQIGFHISSKKSAPNTSSHKFRDDLMQSLREMKQLFVDEKKNGITNGNIQNPINGMSNGNKKID